MSSLIEAENCSALVTFIFSFFSLQIFLFLFRNLGNFVNFNLTLANYFDRKETFHF